MDTEASLQTAQAISVWVPVLSALAGALIGSLSGLLTQLMQGAAERRRERLRLAVQLAIADHDSNVKRAEAWAERSKQVRIMPVSLYVDFHSRFLKSIEDDEMSEETMKQTYEDHEKVRSVIETTAPYYIPK